MDFKKQTTTLLLVSFLLALTSLNWCICRASPLVSQVVAPIGDRPPASSELASNNGDLIIDEEEYQNLLERLRKEAQESIKNNPSNYVSDDTDLDEILQLIGLNNEEIENFSSSSSTTSGPSSSRARPSRSSIRNRQVLQTTTATPQPTPDDCPICLEAMDPQRGREDTLECGHRMHNNCLYKWHYRVGEATNQS